MDEALIRQAITGAQLRSRAELPADHAHVSGPIDEEQILDLIAYVKSLGSQERKRQMSTATADIHEAPVESSVNYLNASYGIKSWLLTVDHKRIGLLYLGVDHVHVLDRRHRGHV